MRVFALLLFLLYTYGAEGELPGPEEHQALAVCGLERACQKDFQVIQALGRDVTQILKRVARVPTAESDKSASVDTLRDQIIIRRNFRKYSCEIARRS